MTQFTPEQRTCDRCGATFEARKGIEHSSKCPKQGDGADLMVVAAEVAACGAAWEPMCRLIGNVRADEIERLALDYIRRAPESRSFTDCAVAVGVAYEADGIAPYAGPPDAVLAEIERLRRDAREVTELRARVVELEDECDRLLARIGGLV